MATKKRIPTRAKLVEATPEVAPEAPVIPTPVPLVSVGSLQAGDQFEHNGERYRRLFLAPSKVVALHLTNPERGWIGVTQEAFDLSTLVIKK